MNEYAMYKGENLLYIGTAQEIAEEHGVNRDTIYHYTSPAYRRRVAKRKKATNYITVIRLDDENA